MIVRTGIVSGKRIGDAISEFTRITGIDQISDSYEAITGKSCGCEKRKQGLNKIQFPSFSILYHS
jgi:hypothetical protein